MPSMVYPLCKPRATREEHAKLPLLDEAMRRFRSSSSVAASPLISLAAMLLDRRLTMQPVHTGGEMPDPAHDGSPKGDRL